MERSFRKSKLRVLLAAMAFAGLSACGGGGGGSANPAPGPGPGPGPEPDPDPTVKVPSITLKRSSFEHLNPHSEEVVTTTGSIEGLSDDAVLRVSEDFVGLSLGKSKPAGEIKVSNGDTFTLSINPKKAFDGVFNNQASAKLELGDKRASASIKLDSLDNAHPVTFVDFPPAKGVTDATAVTIITTAQDNDPASLAMSVNDTPVTPSVLEDGRLSTTIDLGAGVNHINVSFTDGNNNIDTIESVLFRATELVKNPRDIVWSEQDKLAYVLADADTPGSDELVIWAVDPDAETSWKVSGDGVGEGIALPACSGNTFCSGLIDIALDQNNGRNQIIAVGEIVNVNDVVTSVGLAIDISTGNRQDFISAPVDIGALVDPMAVVVLPDNRVVVVDSRSDETALLFAPLTGTTAGKMDKLVSLSNELGAATRMRAVYDHINDRLVLAGDNGTNARLHLSFFDLANDTLVTSTQSVSTDNMRVLDLKAAENAGVADGIEFYVTVRNTTDNVQGVYQVQTLGNQLAGNAFSASTAGTVSALAARRIADGPNEGQLELLAVNRSPTAAMHRKLRSEDFDAPFASLIPDPAKSAAYTEIADLDYMTNVGGLVVDAARNRLLLAGHFPGGTGVSQIDAVDLVTGEVTPFVSKDDLQISLKQYFVFDLVLDVANNRVIALVDDGRGNDRDDGAHSLAGLLAFDLNTGARSVIKLTDATSGAGTFIGKPHAMALHEGTIYVADELGANARILAYLQSDDVFAVIGQEGSSLATPASLAVAGTGENVRLYGVDENGLLFRPVTLDAVNTVLTTVGNPADIEIQSLAGGADNLWFTYRAGADEAGVGVMPASGLINDREIVSGPVNATMAGAGASILEAAPRGFTVDPATGTAYVFDANFGDRQIVAVSLAKRVNEDETTSFIGDRVKISGD